jgi:hypothetical protein
MAETADNEANKQTAASLARQRRAWLRRLWVGRGHPRLYIRALLGALVFGVFCVICYRAALWAANWGGISSAIGGLLALAAVWLAWQVIWRLWLFLAHLGLRGMLILVLVPLLGLYLLTGLTLGGGLGWRGWWLAAQIMAQQAGGRSQTTFKELSAIPDDLSLAFAGRSLSSWGQQPVSSSSAAEITQPTQEATITSAPTPSVIANTPRIIIGVLVRVVNTDGSTLRGRDTPGTDGATVVRFPPNAQLEVIAGPVDKDGYMWWRVQNESGIGWCAATYLEPLN